MSDSVIINNTKSELSGGVDTSEGQLYQCHWHWWGILQRCCWHWWSMLKQKKCHLLVSTMPARISSPVSTTPAMYASPVSLTLAKHWNNQISSQIIIKNRELFRDMSSGTWRRSPFKKIPVSMSSFVSLIYRFFGGLRGFKGIFEGSGKG